MSPLRYDDDSLFSERELRGEGYWLVTDEANCEDCARDAVLIAAARNSDPQTAKDAAKSMTAPILSNQRLRVLELVSRWPDGASAHKVSLLYHFPDIQQNVASRRLKDLADLGLVEECGARPGSSGRLCRVFRITDAGREALR